ncbi:MAG: twin-arginine translocase TatA/TatE family subunit [Candidatus Hydrogenedentes bacterium]|nr:twin-arginine translocase TatA/TatE family subunit [Candidatus Hydrogenedentota bacterium]
MWAPGATELIIILVIVLILFGGSRVAGLGRSLGTAISEFKTAVREEKEPAKVRDGEPEVK